MTNEETIDKMTQMHLHGMAVAMRELLRDGPSQELGPHEMIGMLIDREWQERDNRRLSRLLRSAKLPVEASLEDVWCEPSRGLNKPQVRELATCSWVRAAQNVIVVGKTGCGKSYLGAALAQAACRRGHRALYARVPRLANELAIARGDGSYASTLARLAKVEVLVLDDFLLTSLKENERRDLLEILEDRYGRTSTVIASQVPTKNWHEQLADPTIADAICDRLVHNAHVVVLTGGSMRKKKGMETKDPKVD